MAVLPALLGIARESRSQHVDAHRTGCWRCVPVQRGRGDCPRRFPPPFLGAGRVPKPNFEPAAFITVLVLLGQVLELRARSRTSSAIRALLDLSPKTARRLEDGREVD